MDAERNRANSDQDAVWRVRDRRRRLVSPVRRVDESCVGSRSDLYAADLLVEHRLRRWIGPRARSDRFAFFGCFWREHRRRFDDTRRCRWQLLFRSALSPRRSQQRQYGCASSHIRFSLVGKTEVLTALSAYRIYETRVLSRLPMREATRFNEA